MSSQGEYGVQAYTANKGIGSAIKATGKSDLEIQHQLFLKVSSLLNEAGVEIDGNGPLSLDIDSKGKLQVIGEISNKDEIAAVLQNDKELMNFINNNNDTSSSEVNYEKWSQDAYELDISDESKTYNFSQRKISSDNQMLGIYNKQRENVDRNVSIDLSGRMPGVDDWGYRHYIDGNGDQQLGDTLFVGGVSFGSEEERQELVNYMLEKLDSAGIDFDVIGKMSLTFTSKVDNPRTTDDFMLEINNAFGVGNYGINAQQQQKVMEVLKDDKHIIESLRAGHDLWTANQGFYHIDIPAEAGQNPQGDAASGYQAIQHNNSPESTAPDRALISDASSLGSLLGIKDKGADITSIITALHDKIDKLKSSGAEVVDSILSEQNIKLEADEQFSMSVNNKGEIMVSALEGSEMSEQRLEQIQYALNSHSRLTPKLTNILNKNSAYEQALSELSNSDSEIELSDSTTLAIVEAEIGMPLNQALNKDDSFDTSNSSVKDFITDNPSLAKRIQNMDNISSNGTQASLTYTGDSLVSSQSESLTVSFEKDLQSSISEKLRDLQDKLGNGGIRLNGSEAFGD